MFDLYGVGGDYGYVVCVIEELVCVNYLGIGFLIYLDMVVLYLM